MATADYLKQASANIRRAALARKQEADMLRSDLARKEQEYRRRIDQLRVQKNLLESKIASANTDNNERAHLAREDAAKVDGIHQTENELKRVKERIAQEIEKKERNERELNSMAQNVERRASGL
ncbi:hypothetical protein BH23PAT1_BH23PAT1_1800 [soil metagenome]